MRQTVKDAFFDFTAKREGFTPFMYADTLNLVTTGVGNLIDSGARNGFDTSPARMSQAMNLPWKFKASGWSPKNPVTTGSASQGDIAAAWTATKLQEQNNPGFNKKGGFAYQNLTPVSLDMDGIKALFGRTLNSFDTTLKKRFVNYENWPADAQLALMSMSWAMGPGFDFPQFKAAADAQDFDTAAELSFFKGGGGTQANRSGRNKENQLMFKNAAAVLRSGADLDVIRFPAEFIADSGTEENLLANSNLEPLIEQERDITKVVSNVAIGVPVAGGLLALIHKLITGRWFP